ncbi:hypothetical protein [Haladaptatus sp. CMAA 1911]|uniref:hypothetical protein n=1 Tax=unclassified Haladaptatus TaxID=2622732 RepID=UPI003754ECB8
MRDNKRVSRRKCLRKIGISASAIATIPTSSAAKNTGKKDPGELKLDTSFDPSSKNETEHFVAASFERSENLSKSKTIKGRQELIKELSKRQQESIIDILESVPHTCKVTRTTDQSINQSQDVGTSGYSSYPYKLSCYINPPLVGEKHAFDYKHTIRWAHNGSTISNPEASATGTGFSYYLVNWNYTGSTRDDINNAGNHFTSQKTGSFRNCIAYSFNTVCDTDQAYSELLGDYSGSGAVLNHNCHG